MAQPLLAEVFDHQGPWTEQDYLHLPEDNRRIELLDGGLLMSPNPANPHQRLLTRVWRALDEASPDEMDVLSTVNVRVGPGKILIPDLVVLTTPGANVTLNDGREVVLVIEIMSPGSVAVDRSVKPRLYADAGIPHYLRIELGEAGPTAHVYGLRDGRYAERGRAQANALLTLADPFPATIDLAALGCSRSIDPCEVPIQFTGPTPDWAADVAAHLDRFASNGVPAIDDLWVSSSSALVVRYRVGEDRLAARVARLDRDPTSSEAPTDSERLASNLLHTLHAPAETEWTDGDGYRWWGDRPEDGWESLVSDKRAVTLRSAS